MEVSAATPLKMATLAPSCIVEMSMSDRIWTIKAPRSVTGSMLAPVVATAPIPARIEILRLDGGAASSCVIPSLRMPAAPQWHGRPGETTHHARWCDPTLLRDTSFFTHQ
jgi:hypothetical protein